VEKVHPLKAPLVFTSISAVVFVLIGIFGVIFLSNKEGFVSNSDIKFEKFATEAEFREYLANSTQNYGLGGVSFGTTGVARDLAVQESSNPALPVTEGTPGGEAKRVSETNVQVVGIDEPDIVKTDGDNIFFSSQNFFYPAAGRPMVEPLIVEEKALIYPPDYIEPTTKVVSALPPESINLAGEIKEQGNLLLEGNILMVFSYDKITAFNVEEPGSPREVWRYEYEEGYNYSTARLVDGRAYVVATRYADYNLPCPLPLFKGAQGFIIPCTDVYRPSQPINSDTMFTVLKLEPTSGKIEDSVSFVGSTGSSVIYMSKNAIYATFTTYPNPLEFISNFFAQNRELVGTDTAERINNLGNIDISNESKLNELRIIMEKYLSSLSGDERKRVENEFINRMNAYLKERGRELQITSIVKIDKMSLDIAATGEVPGMPLNQFSLDEYNNDLRIATTLSAGTMFGQGESANDLYVLSGNLELKGQIQGLALGERIFSARFIDDKAYLVTFKQIDPFFVIDLTNPSAPRVAGELKIPGFSSYLHPLSENQILGVGQEEGQVKLSVFDVTSPDNPVESSKYLLDEFWTEVQNNYRAFFEDRDNKIFFLPAGSNGYIFKYDSGLSLARAVTNISAERALYINNYLYIVGSDKIVVLDEANWEQVGALNF